MARIPYADENENAEVAALAAQIRKERGKINKPRKQVLQQQEGASHALLNAVAGKVEENVTREAVKQIRPIPSQITFWL